MSLIQYLKWITKFMMLHLWVVSWLEFYPAFRVNDLRHVVQLSISWSRLWFSLKFYHGLVWSFYNMCWDAINDWIMRGHPYKQSVLTSNFCMQNVCDSVITFMFELHNSALRMTDRAIILSGHRWVIGCILNSLEFWDQIIWQHQHVSS